MFDSELTLEPIPPFSFDLSASIFSNGDRQIRIYEFGEFRQIIRLESKIFLMTLKSVGTVENPFLKVELKSNSPISHADVDKAKQAVVRLFNLELDLTPFYNVAKKDQTLWKVARRLRGLHSPTTQTVFEALMDSIIEQQISLQVATAIERRIAKKLGESLSLEGEVYYSYPTPEALAGADSEELRKLGLSRRKIEYIKEISFLVVDRKLNLEKFRAYKNVNDIIEELDVVRGVGTWTAELTVIRALQKWDAMPVDDVGLKRIISQYYCDGKRITSEETRKISEPWGEWRGLAAFYFVIADLLGIKV